MAKREVNLFELVPHRAREHAECDDGTVEVLLPRYGDGRIGRILAYVFSNKPVRIRLDDLGTAVWRRCNGRRTVHEIGEDLRSEFGEEAEPLFDRLALFLQQMRRHGMIELTDRRANEQKSAR